MSRDFEFADTTDNIDVGTWSVSGTEITVAVWVKFESFAVSDARIYAKANGTGIQNHVLMLGTQTSGPDMRLRIRLKTGTSDTSGTETLLATSGNLVVDTWYHVVLWYQGGTLKIYLDGAEVGTTTKTGSLRENAWSTQWGNNPVGDRSLDGTLGDGGVWSASLSTDELGALARGVSPIRISPQNLEGYWPLYGTGSPEPDYSGNGRHGTVTGAVQADHAPVMAPFGFDVPLYLPTVAAAGGVFPLVDSMFVELVDGGLVIGG